MPLVIIVIFFGTAITLINKSTIFISPLRVDFALNYVVIPSDFANCFVCKSTKLTCFYILANENMHTPPCLPNHYTHLFYIFIFLSAIYIRVTVDQNMVTTSAFPTSSKMFFKVGRLFDCVECTITKTICRVRRLPVARQMSVLVQIILIFQWQSTYSRLSFLITSPTGPKCCISCLFVSSS